jgi:hypothetical protein
MNINQTTCIVYHQEDILLGATNLEVASKEVISNIAHDATSFFLTYTYLQYI